MSPKGSRNSYSCNLNRLRRQPLTQNSILRRRRSYRLRLLEYTAQRCHSRRQTRLFQYTKYRKYAYRLRRLLPHLKFKRRRPPLFYHHFVLRRRRHRLLLPNAATPSNAL